MRDLFLFFQPTQTCEPVWVCVPDVALNWFTKQKLIHTHTHIDTQTGAQTHEGCAPFARAWSMSTSTLCTYLCVYFGSGLSLGSYAVAFASWYFDLVTHGQCDMLPLPSAPASCHFPLVPTAALVICLFAGICNLFTFTLFTLHRHVRPNKQQAELFSLWYPVNNREAAQGAYRTWITCEATQLSYRISFSLA